MRLKVSIIAALLLLAGPANTQVSSTGQNPEVKVRVCGAVIGRVDQGIDRSRAARNEQVCMTLRMAADSRGRYPIPRDYVCQHLEDGGLCLVWDGQTVEPIGSTVRDRPQVAQAPVAPVAPRPDLAEQRRQAAARAELDQQVAERLRVIGQHRRAEAERQAKLQRDAATARSQDPFSFCGPRRKGEGGCAISY